MFKQKVNKPFVSPLIPQALSSKQNKSNDCLHSLPLCCLEEWWEWKSGHVPRCPGTPPQRCPLKETLMGVNLGCWCSIHRRSGSFASRRAKAQLSFYNRFLNNAHWFIYLYLFFKQYAHVTACTFASSLRIICAGWAGPRGAVCTIHWPTTADYQEAD